MACFPPSCSGECFVPSRRPDAGLHTRPSDKACIFPVAHGTSSWLVDPGACGVPTVDAATLDRSTACTTAAARCPNYRFGLSLSSLRVASP